jgi:glycosyltransferase involved in cell wall biosynthesis
VNVVHVITSLGGGGAEGVLTRLCIFDKNNSHTIICLMEGGVHKEALEVNGVKVICLGMPRGKFTFSGLKNLYKQLRDIQPDVVQTWMYHSDLIGGIIARLALVKRVVWNIRHSNLNPSETKTSTIFIAKLCAFLSYFIPSKVICCAQEAESAHIAIGYKPGKITVIGNGYDLSQYKAYEVPSDIRKQNDIGANKPLLGMVGRYTSEKDHKNLFKAMNHLCVLGEDFYLALAGTGMTSDNEALYKLLTKYSLEGKVILLGQIQDIPSFMNQLDFHILSSSSEGFPNVLAEAMACEVPCVTTDAGSAKLIVNDTGWVVPVNNSEALAGGVMDAFSEMRGHNEKWLLRKANARLRVMRQFSLQSMAEQYIKVWQ